MLGAVGFYLGVSAAPKTIASVSVPAGAVAPSRPAFARRCTNRHTVYVTATADATALTDPVAGAAAAAIADRWLSVMQNQLADELYWHTAPLVGVGAIEVEAQRLSATLYDHLAEPVAWWVWHAAPRPQTAHVVLGRVERLLRASSERLCDLSLRRSAESGRGEAISAAVLGAADRASSVRSGLTFVLMAARVA